MAVLEYGLNSLFLVLFFYVLYHKRFGGNNDFSKVLVLATQILPGQFLLVHISSLFWHCRRCRHPYSHQTTHPVRFFKNSQQLLARTQDLFKSTLLSLSSPTSTWKWFCHKKGNVVDSGTIQRIEDFWLTVCIPVAEGARTRPATL